MKKIFILLFASVLVLSCTKDVELADTTADLTESISQYDATNLGIYKGVFTTQGTMERGVVEINVIPGNYATATILTVKGQTITFKSSEIIEEGMEINELKLEAIGFGETSFLFSTDLDGTNVIISRVMYNGKKAGMIAAHDTSLAPVVPITGVLACDDCDAHPLMVTGDTGTFSLVFVGDGSAGDTVTALADVGVVVSTPGSQPGCAPLGSQMICDIFGGGTIGTNVIDWIGDHIYNTADDCSEATGFWSLDSGNHGSFTGTFTSDTTCSGGGLAGDVPATAIPITLGAEGDGCATPSNTALLATDGHTDSGLPTACFGAVPDIYYSWT
ncbi:MAG: hypothetical protein KUG68_06645, partial [Flavobacteriaceae bacterium]|nr:hypothetical protein [Flavobacteriaceae bacterium]